MSESTEKEQGGRLVFAEGGYAQPLPAPLKGAGRLIQISYRVLLSACFMHAVFLLGLLASVLLYRDRLMGDVAYYIWNFTATGDFAIFHNRWPNMLVQWPALLGIRLGAPLGLVIVLYSVAYTSLYYGVALALRYLLKAPHAAFALTLFFIAVTTHGFIWPIDELANGVAILFLLGPLFYARRPLLSAFAAFCIALTGCFFHALAIGVAIFLTGFHLLACRRGLRLLPFLATLAAIGIVVAERFFFSGLEQQELQQIDYALFAEHLRAALVYLGGGALIPAGVLFCTLLGALCLARRFVQAGALAAATLGFLGLVVLRYSFAETFPVYLWHMLCPVFGFSLLALAASEKPSRALLVRAMLVFSTLLLIAHALLAIPRDIAWLRARQEKILRIGQAAGADQPLGAIDPMTRNFIGPFAWAAGDECLVLSALKGRDQARLLAAAPPLPWHLRWTLPMNQHYFNLPEHLTPALFTPLNTAASPEQLTAHISQHVRLAYSPPATLANCPAEIPVTIVNEGAAPLPSRCANGRPLSFVAVWERPDGKGLLSPAPSALEVDVFSEYTLPLQTLLPQYLPGLKLRVAFLIENQVVFPPQPEGVPMRGAP